MKPSGCFNEPHNEKNQQNESQKCLETNRNANPITSSTFNVESAIEKQFRLKNHRLVNIGFLNELHTTIVPMYDISHYNLLIVQKFYTFFTKRFLVVQHT